jgi:hypothetical protein
MNSNRLTAYLLHPFSPDSVKQLEKLQEYKLFLDLCSPSLIIGSSSRTQRIEIKRTKKEGTMKLEPGSEETDNRLPNCNIGKCCNVAPPSFILFSKIHAITWKSPKMKLVRLFMISNFALRTISKF